MVDVKRRRLLAAASVSAAALTARSAVSAAVPSSPSAILQDPTARLDTFCRMRCGPDGAKAWFGYEGTFFGKIEGRVAVPLMGIVGLSWNRAVEQAPGRYRYELQEAGYMVDLDTREVIDDWVNPLNGASTRPKHYRSGQETIFTPDTVTPATPLPHGIRYTGTISRPVVQGNSIWMSEDLLVSSPNSPERYDDPRMYSGPTRTATSLATFLSPVDSALDPDAAFVPCTLSYTTINSWRPWMLMGETPGVISWRLVGRKVARPEDLPTETRDRIERDHPELLN